MRRLAACLLMLLVALPAGCEPFFTQAELDRVSHRGFIEQNYRIWWQAAYDVYRAGDGELEQPPLFAGGLLAPEDREHTPMPQPVRDAWRFYYANVELADFGNVYVSSFVLNNRDRLWVVRTSTDGDDGWVELYRDDGAWLEAGRTWLELIAWVEREADVAALREQVQTGALPAALDDRSVRTLWQP